MNQGGSTWGMTREEALAHLREVIQLVVESLVAHGESIPDQPADQAQVITEPKVAITV
ncbi:MAG TPA: type II toxin-antitoxin system HicB family antitoxin [Candidatus Sumerlaeota bacterium]|nr:type II toxin-antitoxin system HicB family antitoxin [Candidatus Sumerlaeota bacterium]